MFTDEVKSAFAGVPYPGDDLIVYDNSGYHLECSDIAAKFRRKHWSALSPSLLRRYYAALSFFTFEAYHFYLPAYLIISVESFYTAEHIPGTVIFSLTAPSVRKKRDYERFRAKVCLFDRRQREVIVKFLQIMRDEHVEDYPDNAPEDALRSYWLSPPSK